MSSQTEKPKPRFTILSKHYEPGMLRHIRLTYEDSGGKKEQTKNYRVVCTNFGTLPQLRHSWFTQSVDTLGMLRNNKSPFRS